MRKGVSPIIATVLLLAITVTLAFVIFSSSKEFIAQLAPAADCQRVSFESSIHKEEKFYVLEINNIGNEIIEGFNLAIEDSSLGEKDIQKISLVVNPGQAKSQEINLDLENKELSIIPIIKNAENTPLVCDDSFAKVLTIN